MRSIEYFDEASGRVVATLTEKEGGIWLSYSDGWSGNTLDPMIPLGFSGMLSEIQIDGLMDVIPSKVNGFYKEFCKKWRISPDESDVMTILCTLGHRTIQSAICRPAGGWKPGLWSEIP